MVARSLKMEAQNTKSEARFARRCRLVAWLLVPSLPVLRLAEAGARLLFLPRFYESYWDALTTEMWFSPSWWLYARTSFGWWALYALVLWIAAVPVVAHLPAVRRRKTFGGGVAGACLVVLWVVTFRLEFYWDGRSQSEWVWCLRSRDPELRRQAARGLSWHVFKFGVPDGTVPLARRGLHDEVLEVRRFATSFFAQYPSAGVIPDLTEALSDPDDRVRYDAARALAQLGPAATGALPQLKARLDDPVPAVRACAADAYLAAGGDAALGLSTLQRLLKEPDPQDRICTAHVLGRVAVRYPGGAFPLVADLLRDADGRVRFYTTLALSGLGPRAKPLTPELLVCLTDSDYLVRGSAARVLGEIDSPDDHVVAAIVPLLKDPEWWVRRDAAYALGYMGAVRATPALEDALNDSEEQVRSGARSSLDRLERGVDRNGVKRK